MPTTLTLNPLTGNFDVILVATATVQAWMATPSSANLAAAVTDETGSGALVFATSPTFTTTATVTRSALAAVSTDGLIVENATASTAGVPVQISPRLRFRSHVWNTTATAADNIDDWFIESSPVSTASPIAFLTFNSSQNGAAATTPLSLTGGTNPQFLMQRPALANSLRLFFMTGGFTYNWNVGMLAASSDFTFKDDINNQSRIRLKPGSAAGELALDGATGNLLLSNAASIGVVLDYVTTDATLKIRTRAQTADAQLSAASVRGNAVAFASVPGTPVEGMLVAITDSSTATWGATITGGGANHVLGFFNGTNWTVAGK